MAGLASEDAHPFTLTSFQPQDILLKIDLNDIAEQKGL
jgi:hypothetical protein